MTALTFRTDVFGRINSFNSVSLNPVSGFTPKQYDLAVKRWGFYDNGGTYGSQRSAWSLSGYTGTNTAMVAVAGVPLVQRIYFKATGTTNYEVSGWSEPTMAVAAKEVCNGSVTRSSGGSVALSEANSSGLTGSFTVAAAATNDTWYVDIKVYHDRYDGSVDGSSNNILGFLFYQDLENDATLKTWSIAETGEIVDFDKLLSLSCADNVADVFKRNTLKDNLRAKGFTS